MQSCAPMDLCVTEVLTVSITEFEHEQVGCCCC